jgi:hypothetical protein
VRYSFTTLYKTKVRTVIVPSLAVAGYVLSCCCVVSMYWSKNMEGMLVLASLFVGSGSVCFNALMSVVVDLFPTSLR